MRKITIAVTGGSRIEADTLRSEISALLDSLKIANTTPGLPRGVSAAHEDRVLLLSYCVEVEITNGRS